MPNCVVSGCQNRQSAGCGKTFHKFPIRNEKLFKRWLNNVGRDNWNPSTKSVVCSDHFIHSDFDRTGQTTRLYDHAVPSVFQNQTHKHLEKCGVEHSPVQIQLNQAVNKYSDHTYSTSCSPRQLKRKLDQALDGMQSFKKRLKFSQQKSRGLKEKVKSLDAVVETLKNKGLVSENCVKILQKTYSGVPLAVLRRELQNKGKPSRETYPPILRSFAMTLHFYSAKAYNYVRRSFNFNLPHPSVLRKWYQDISGNPGFTKESFLALKQRATEAKEQNREVLCGLMLDEMSIRKHVEWDGKQFLGYVNIGTNVGDDDEDDTTPLATEVLVLMAVSINGNWKVPLGYFFIHGLTSAEKANIVTNCLIKMNDSGVKTVSLTCDGPSCHMAMIKELGADLSIENMSPWFPHPSNQDHRFHVVMDICHMLKLVRNNLASSLIIRDRDGNTIRWFYFEKLHILQESEGLRLGNRLRSAHMEFQKQKMKVNLAAQTISSSVADAMEFCKEDLQLELFEGCGPTVKFVRIFDHLFDIFNSRNPCAKGYKSPMKPSNEHLWRPFLHEAYEYIKGLTSESGTPMYETRKKTPFVGFMSAIKSIQSLYDSLIVKPSSSFRYLLTYKLSQDHLELFFSAIRSSGGCNNNPTAKQFVASYKRLLMRHEVKASGNCTPQDSTTILSAVTDCMKVDNQPRDILDVNVIKRYNLQVEEPAMKDHDYIQSLSAASLSLYKEATVGYIAGFVVRMLRKKICCSECLCALVLGETTVPLLTRYSLVQRKTRGGLLLASASVILICEATERCFQRTLAVTGNKPPRASLLTATIQTVVLQEAVYKGAFDNLNSHMLDSTPDNNHVFSLIKSICSCYITIRMHHIAKQHTALVTGSKVRKQYSKLILFKHQ